MEAAFLEDDFEDDDDGADCMAGPSLFGVMINSLIDRYMDATDPAKADPSAEDREPRRTAPPLPKPTPESLANFREFGGRQVTATKPEAPKKRGLESLIRFAGSFPAPVPVREPVPEIPGLACVFRFAGEQPQPSVPDPDDDGCGKLAELVRFRGC